MCGYARKVTEMCARALTGTRARMHGTAVTEMRARMHGCAVTRAYVRRVSATVLKGERASLSGCRGTCENT